MKRLLFVFLTFILVGCSNATNDEEALSNIMNGLNDRWSYSDELEEAGINDYKKSIQLELDHLEEFPVDTFKDVKLYRLYDDYRRELENGLSIVKQYDDAEELYRDWFIHSEERGTLLKEINNNFSLDIPDDKSNIFEEITSFKASDLGGGFNSKVSESQGLYYMEEMTARYLNSSQLDNDSFEQKSELNACLKRADSLIDELKEKFGEDDSFVIDMVELGNKTKKSCQDKLNGQYEKDRDNARKTGQILGDIARLYTKGKLPPTTIKITGKTRAD